MGEMTNSDGAPESPAQSGDTLSQDQLAARKRRSVALAVALVMFVAVVFALTLVHLKEQVLERSY